MKKIKEKIIMFFTTYIGIIVKCYNGLKTAINEKNYEKMVLYCLALVGIVVVHILFVWASVIVVRWVVKIIEWILILLIIALAVAIYFIIEFKDEIVVYIKTMFAPPLTLENDDVCWIITQFLFNVISAVNNVLNEYIKPPKTENDLYDISSFRSSLYNAPTLKLHLLKKQTELSDDDLDYIKNVIQGSIKARLLDGFLIGYTWAVPVVADVPLVKIAVVECSEMYIHLGVLLTNTQASVKAAVMSDKAKSLTKTDDTDPLFKGG